MSTQKQLRYLSLFSGIGGFELGIQRAFGVRPTKERQHESDNVHTEGKLGSVCVGYSEIDKYADATYQQHFGGHRNYGDATKINARELPDFDLLVGGFPCQAFSVAGKRLGFDDTRGTLFFDIARILSEKRPRHLVLENVKGLLSHDSGKTFQTILGVLTDLGYFVEWQVLNSKDFGVPQNRERVFIVGHLGGEPRRKVFPIFGNHTKDTSPTLRATYYKGYQTRGPMIATRQPLRFLNRNQKNIDGDYAYTVDASQTSGVRQAMRIRRLTPLECERLQGFPDTEESATITVCKQVSANGAEKTSSTNDTDQNNAVQNSVLISCEENAVEIRSQGKLLWSANTATSQSRSALPMPIGDFAQAVAGIVQIVAKITQDGRAESVPNDKSLTVQASGKNSVKIYGLEIMRLVGDVEHDMTTAKNNMKSIISSPLSTENIGLNLQTLFSYVMTAISGYIPEAIFTESISTIQFKSKRGWTIGSDTQRYKQCGNAVTVNVVEAVMRGLYE